MLVHRNRRATPPTYQGTCYDIEGGINEQSKNLRIDLYIHQDTLTTDAKLDKILAALTVLQQQETTIMADLTALTTQVAQNTSVEESAVTLIQGLAAQIVAAGTDPAKLADLTAQLNKSAADLAAAITANTPTA